MVSWNNQDETYGGDVLYLDLRDSLKGFAHMSKVFWAVHSTFMYFTEGKLYLNKVLLAKKIIGYLDLGLNFREEVNMGKKLV